MVKSNEPITITILKAASIASTVFYLVFNCVVAGLAYPKVNEEILDLYEHSRLRQSEDEPFYIVNVVRYTMVMTITMAIVISLIGLVATIIESSALLTTTSVLLFATFVVRAVFIGHQRFVPLALSLPLILIELAVIVLTFGLGTRICARECSVSNYVSGLFQSL